MLFHEKKLISKTLRKKVRKKLFSKVSDESINKKALYLFKKMVAKTMKKADKIWYSVVFTAETQVKLNSDGIDSWLKQNLGMSEKL